MDEKINPPHYRIPGKEIEVIEMTEELNFNRGNAVKYILRAGKKEGESELDDLRKAEWYLKREISRISFRSPS